MKKELLTRAALVATLQGIASATADNYKESLKAYAAAVAEFIALDQTRPTAEYYATLKALFAGCHSFNYCAACELSGSFYFGRVFVSEYAEKVLKAL